MQELIASFASRRGLFVTGIFVITWAFLLFYPINFAAQSMQGAEGGSLILAALDLIGLEPLKIG